VTPSADEEAPSAEEKGEVGLKDGDSVVVILSLFSKSLIVEEGSS